METASLLTIASSTGVATVHRSSIQAGRRALALLTTLCVTFSGWAVSSAAASNSGGITTSPTTPKPQPKPVVASHLVLPSKKLTPGAHFSAASVATICKAGYTARVAKVPESVRKQVFARYQIDYALRSKYELDHLVSLDVGGNNAMTNLWPEPLAGKYGAHAKDAVESKLHTMVCSGRSLLHDVQHAEAVNWYTSVKVLSRLLRPKPPGPSPTPSPTPVPTPTPTPPPAPSGFGDGTHLVGSDMPAGTYSASGGSSCYWERERDTSGQLSGIIANGFGDTHPIVAIDSTDVAFKTTSCGVWRLFVPPAQPATSFGDGTYMVGQSIVAGTYSAPGGSSCYWERRSDVSGSVSGVIANDFGAITPTVTIAAIDVAFDSTSCGTWQLMSVP
jgi:hypothetical protein